MNALAEKVDTPLTQEAFVLATMEAAHYKLLLGDHEGTKAGMDACEKVLERLDSVDLAVHAAFYRVSGDYYKVCCVRRSVSVADVVRLGEGGVCGLLQELAPVPRVHRHQHGTGAG